MNKESIRPFSGLKFIYAMMIKVKFKFAKATRNRIFNLLSVNHLSLFDYKGSRGFE